MVQPDWGEKGPEHGPSLPGGDSERCWNPRSPPRSLTRDEAAPSTQHHKHSEAEIPCLAFQGSQGKPTAIGPQPARPGLQRLGCSWKIIIPKACLLGHCSPHPLPRMQQNGEPSQTTPLQKAQTPHTGYGPPWAAQAHQDMAPALKG